MNCYFKFNLLTSDFPAEKQDSLGPSIKRPRLDAAEVKAMSAKQYMDELIVPILLKGLSVCNKQVLNRQYPAAGFNLEWVPYPQTVPPFSPNSQIATDGQYFIFILASN